MFSSENGFGVSCTLSSPGGGGGEGSPKENCRRDAGQQKQYMSILVSLRGSAAIYFTQKQPVMKTDTVAKTIDMFVLILFNLRDVS